MTYPDKKPFPSTPRGFSDFLNTILKPEIDTVGKPAVGFDKLGTFFNNQIIVKLKKMLPPEFVVGSVFYTTLTGKDVNGKPVELKNIKIIKICPFNRRLILLSGKGLELIAQVDGVTGSPDFPTPPPPPPPPKGIGGSYALPAPNAVINTPQVDPNDTSFQDIILPIPPGYRPLVAVMDSGLDKAYLETNFPILDPKTDPIYGWNFVDNTNDFHDNFSVKHGTRITKIIAKKAKYQVRILPLKVTNENFSTFFDLFSAFECVLAHPEKVTMINASWGYYGGKIPMFEEYMKAFKKKRIVVVNAAGNKSDFPDFLPKEIGRPNTWRFPACDSTPDNHIYTVTSVANNAGHAKTESTHVPTQNFSGNFVDIGVVGIDSQGAYPEPLVKDGVVPQPANIQGSSFANPYVVGALALHLSNDSKLFKKKSKEAILNLISQTESATILNEDIRDNRFMEI